MERSVHLALHSRPLRMGINIEQHYTLSQHQDGEEEITGFCIELIDIMAQSLNISYELVLPADGEWGDEEDGQWTGLMGLLQRKEADMAFMLSPSLQRSAVAQWTVPVEYWYNNIAVRTHTVQPHLWATFASPFHWSVYMAVLGSFVLCTYLLLHVMSTEQSLLPASGQAWSPSEAGEFLWGSLLGRGVSRTWTGRAGSLFIASWCVLTFMLTSCYTSKLTSLMVGVTPSPPFTTVKEMLARDDYRWGMVGGTKLVQILRESNNSLEQELYYRMMAFAEDDPDVLSRDRHVHLSKVLSENYAFISNSHYMVMWTSEYCDITMLPVKLTGLEYNNILLPKDSLITGLIDQLLLRLHDSGSMAYLLNRWFPSSSRCHGKQSPQQTISLPTLQGPFYAAAAGLLLAAAVLGCERCGHRRGALKTLLADHVPACQANSRTD